jgi:hypothetical protein
MKIEENLIPYTYQESKRVFENKLSAKEASENINLNCGIKITSSMDYYYYFKFLMTGEGSCRVLSKFTQEYYLAEIEKDYGKEQLKKSLKAFYQLVEKLEKGNGSTKKSMRAIYEKYIVSV